jgi:hypothetical protein
MGRAPRLCWSDSRQFVQEKGWATIARTVAELECDATVALVKPADEANTEMYNAALPPRF